MRKNTHPPSEKILRFFFGNCCRAWITLIGFLLLISYGIAVSSADTYSASITMYIDREYLLEISEKEAAAIRLEDIIETLRDLILSEDFIAPHIIQELGLTLEEVTAPPLRLKFMHHIDDIIETIRRQMTKKENEAPAAPSPQQNESRITAIIKKNLQISLSEGKFLTISYTGTSLGNGRKIVWIVRDRCSELLSHHRNQKIRETVRLIERQYTEIGQRLEELEQQLAETHVEQFDQTPESRVALFKQRQHAQNELMLIEAEMKILLEKKHAWQEEFSSLEQRSASQTQESDTTQKELLLRQLSEIEMQELALRRKEVRLRTEIALHEKRIATMAAQETPDFRSVQIEIELYKKLHHEIAQKRESARIKYELTKSRTHWFWAVDRSFPDKPVWGSPRDMVWSLWALGLLFIILKMFFFRLFRWFKYAHEHKRRH